MSEKIGIRCFFEQRVGKKIITNASFPMDKLFEISNRPQCSVLCGESYLIFLLDESDFCRIYYYADNQESIIEILNLLAERDDDCFVLEKIFTSLGDVKCDVENIRWQQFRTLRYMTLRSLEENGYTRSEDVKIELACSEDIGELFALLGRLFDAKVSHLPEYEKLHHLIDTGCVWVIKEDEEIVSFVLVEVTGKKTRYIYQVGTIEAARRKGYAKKIIRHIVSSNPDGMVYSLWVEEENIAAKQLYEELGFVESSRVLKIWIKDRRK